MSSIIVIALIILSFYKEPIHITNIFSKDKINLSYIEIEKIGLKEKVIEDSIFEKKITEIVMFEEYGRPDLMYSNTIIEAHSGGGKHSFFTDLDKLNIDDVVYFYYKEKKYKYKVIKRFYVDQKETKILNNIKDKTTLTLFTCNEENNNYRLVLLLDYIDFS